MLNFIKSFFSVYEQGNAIPDRMNVDIVQMIHVFESFRLSPAIFKNESLFLWFWNEANFHFLDPYKERRELPFSALASAIDVSVDIVSLSLLSLFPVSLICVSLFNVSLFKRLC